MDPYSTMEFYFFLVVACGSVSDPRNGYANHAGIEYTDTVLYNCNTGYMLRGHETRICDENGNWTGQPPLCIGKANTEL